jgi:hypothetical protein
VTIRRTLYSGFQDALLPVQPLASLEWPGIFSILRVSEDENLKVYVRPRILPSNYRRVAAICCPSTLIRAWPTSRTSLQKSILKPLNFSNNSEPAILKPKQNHEMPLANILL